VSIKDLVIMSEQRFLPMGEQIPIYAEWVPSPGSTDHERAIDMVRLRGYRLGRVQAELRKRDYGACLLYDPINIRYATGTRNMTVWTMHNAARYCIVPAEGRAVLFDYRNSEHLSTGIETIYEVRPGKFWYYHAVADRKQERIRQWAHELVDVLRELAGENRRLAVDHVDGEGWDALLQAGLQLFDAQEVLEQARCIKSDDEIACMVTSISVAEAGLSKLRDSIEPGRTEIDLWSILSATNSRMGGEFMETRLLSSGTRTNPWYQECSTRLVRPGDLVAVDTDMVGPFGYNADISRTFLCGPGRPTGHQRKLYSLAHEQIDTNIDLLRPGASFREIWEKGWKPPEGFADQSAGAMVHGIGLCNEYPQIPARNFDAFGYDGMLLENMTVCVESYVGEKGGSEGVKLEQVVLITAGGPRILTKFPFEPDLL
jgi:Xaa-Pro dipeptidase